MTVESQHFFDILFRTFDILSGFVPDIQMRLFDDATVPLQKAGHRTDCAQGRGSIFGLPARYFGFWGARG